MGDSDTPMSFLLLALTLTLTLLPFSLCRSFHEAEVKGMFVFGSSLVDNGNNNFLTNSSARADYPPYGIDFPLGASGRFSNGRNPIDVLGELLKLPSLIPPFADPKTRVASMVHGVNYASGGSGILDQTGSITGMVISLKQQINNFETRTLPDLKTQLRENRRLFGHLSKCLFVVGTGGNDYLLNYFVPNARVNKPKLTKFTAELLDTLSYHLKKLHALGARKFVLFSLQAMGCVPVVRAQLQASNGSCVEMINQAALLFNSQLKSLVRDAKSLLPGSNVVYIDSYNIIRNIIDDPIRNGFSDTSSACCELSSNKEGGDGILCRRGGRACVDRTAHVFFDGLHPTDAVNARIAGKAYDSCLETEVYPMNVKQLALL